MNDCLKKILIVGTVLLTFLISAVAYAGHDEIPRIPIDDLKKMIDQKADIVILDAQLKEIYDSGHIKGALSLPWKQELTFEDTASLPKNKLIVVYCDCGPGETDSSDVAFQLTGLGFDNVKILADPSVRGWKKAGYPMEK
jgi:rhodanese-related sulfurtransferase